MNLGNGLGLPLDKMKTNLSKLELKRNDIVKNLNEIIHILENMQCSPCKFYRKQNAVENEATRIRTLIEEIGDQDVLNYQKEVVIYGIHDHKFIFLWRLVGPSTDMVQNQQGGNQSLAFCENVGEKHYRCNINMTLWDGSIPGEQDNP